MIVGNLLLTAIALSALAELGVAVLAWRQRPDPGSTWLAANTVAAAVWAGGYAAGLLATDLATKLFWSKVQWVAIVVVPLTWFGFCLAYTGRDEYLSRRNVAALLTIPAVTLPLALFDAELLRTVSGTIRYDGLTLLDQTFGPWYAVFVIYSYALLAAATLALFRIALDRRSPHRTQMRVLAVAAIVPWIGSVLFLIDPKALPPIDFTPITFAVSGPLALFAVSRFEFLDAVPAPRQIGRHAIVADLDDAILVVDERDRVVDANPAAMELFGDAEVVGSDARAAVPNYDDRVVDGVATVSIETDGRVAYFDVSTTELVDHLDRRIGRALVFHDVTDRHDRKRRLGVLNGILRKTLTDRMDELSTHASALSETDDGASAMIRETAEEALATGEKAATVGRLLDGVDPDEPDEPIDLVPTVHRELDRVRNAFPDVEFDLDAQLSEWGYCDAVFEPVLANLLENAAAHNNAPDPHVNVTLRRTDDGRTVVTVGDNGPGLDAEQREILLEGTRADPENSDGLGLWLVNWGVRQMDGDVGYRQNDPRGSVVELTVPVRSAE